MLYDEEFEKDFMRRTKSILDGYQGQFEATLLINCLLGLLILPKEKLEDCLPDVEFNSLSSWGIQSQSIIKKGKCDHGHQHDPSLKQLMRRLRNAAAHFRVEPIHDEEKRKVKGFKFADSNGFEAVFSLVEIRSLLNKIAEHIGRGFR